MHETAGRRPSSERAANTERVLAALTGPALTQAELRTATGLSRPTLSAILAELRADGWVRATTPSGRPSAPGRPARSFRVDPAAVHVAGVDVGLHSVRVAVADAAGTWRHATRRDVAPDVGGSERLDAVRHVVEDAARAAGLDVADLDAICLGVPGIVDADGRITRSSVVPDWDGVHVGRSVARWAGCAVDVVNDANLAAIGERWAGAARMCDDVVYLHLGRRTSAALLLDGRVHTGRTGGAGEIGSLPTLFFDSPTILVGADAGQDDPRLALTFADAAAGDADAAGRVAEFGRHVARSVDVLATILDPDVVVLGGGLSRAGATLLDAVRRHVAHADVTRVVLGALADAAVTTGGVRRALLLAAREEPRLRPLLHLSPAPARKDDSHGHG